MATILDKIVAAKRQEIAAARVAISVETLEHQVQNALPCRDFFAVLAAEGPIKLIAEVKKASPSKGVIREDFQPLEIAQAYERGGASCLSVLTIEIFFEGNLEYLRQIRKQISLPALRKDFILDSYQLLEARAAGADAVLLIAECLDDCDLRKLHNETIELGMTPLVEFYEPENLNRVLEAGATLIGVNNRDLRTSKVDLDHTIRMREHIPDDCLLVGESGIRTHADVRRFEDAGVDAILVGESLMRQDNIETAVRNLLGLPV